MSEQSIASARASVMIYDDVNKKWVPSGTSSGLSKVHIYQHTVQQTFRVVGRKLQDHEVVINCAILKGLKYNQATATFHQWRDNKQVYGLNFSSKEDADQFARAMFHSLEILSNIVRQPNPPLPPQYVTQSQPPQHHQYDEDMGYRTMTQEDVTLLQERRISTATSPIAPPMMPSNSIPNSVGHQRTTSAPPAPPPPPPSGNSGSGGPPPPPPPLPNMTRSQSSGETEVNSLAAQLQNARLKKKSSQPPQTENSGSSTSSGGSSNYGTLGRAAGSSMASMMDEMAKTLARRRAAVEKKDKPALPLDDDEKKAAIWEKTNTLPAPIKHSAESPKSGRKQTRFGCSSEETILKAVNGLNGNDSSNDLEVFKAELLREIRKESVKIKEEAVEALRKDLAKMKQEIVEAIKSELNRR